MSGREPLSGCQARDNGPFFRPFYILHRTIWREAGEMRKPVWSYCPSHNPQPPMCLLLHPRGKLPSLLIPVLVMYLQDSCQKSCSAYMPQLFGAGNTHPNKALVSLAPQLLPRSPGNLWLEEAVCFPRLLESVLQSVWLSGKCAVPGYSVNVLLIYQDQML